MTRCKTACLLLALLIVLSWSVGVGQVGPEREQAQQILQAAGVKGGLIVHVGCGDGKLTAALYASDRYLVHGLDADAKNIEQARKHIQSLGLYGKASVEQWSGKRLPYADNLVNLLVVSGEWKVEREETMRILAPNGVAVFFNPKSKIQNPKLVKPWPKEIDEWTHFLHDAGNNAVAKDTIVAPPKSLQWIAKPLYSRSHEIDSSISTLVSARGRVFYILDEGLTGITDERLPPLWSLVARDAFSGVLLWKKPIPRWGWREWKREQLEGKDWTTLSGQRGHFPSELSRRAVAHGDRVYATLGYVAPLTILDAATGEVIRTCEGTEGADEILYSDGLLVLRVRDLAADGQKQRGEPPPPERLLALDPETGKTLWKRDAGKIITLCLAVDGGRVLFFNGKEVVCLGLNTGEETWRTLVGQEKKKQPQPAKAKKKKGVGGGHTFVAAQGVALLLGPAELVALDGETGKVLWRGPGGSRVGAVAQPDLFVAQGLAWLGKPVPGLGGQGDEGGKGATGALLTGYDLRTGEVKKTVEVPNAISPGHHFRCYRSKATERFILWPKRGVEFIDLQGDDHMRHDWLRAPCKLGVMPCNGLLYMAPHQCFCYPDAKVDGFLALSGQRSEVSNQKPEVSGQRSERLEKGPAYHQIRNPQSAIRNQDWPTFRHDPKRSGSTASAVPTQVKPLWQADLGGRLAQPVVADGTLFIASVDAHTLHALMESDGKPLWTYTAGGRIDSPPTIHNGLVLFGSADGWVYCLRASDGQLAWRFHAAPTDRRVVAFDQVESAWPMHGSVLVLPKSPGGSEPPGGSAIVYCTAGRATYLDGGIYVYALDPSTGKALHQTCVAGPWPDLSKDIGRPFDMEGDKSDVLTSDGKFIYMRHTMLDDKLVDQQPARVTNMGDRKMGRHLFSTGSLLDDSWWNRTFWMYTERWPGFYIANQSPKAGQMLVFDEATTYGVQCFTRRNCHSPMFFPGKEGYLLFADDNENEPVLVDDEGNPKVVNRLPYETFTSSRGNQPVTTPTLDKDKGVGFTGTLPPKWTQWVPIRAQAMVKTANALFIAGPPDVLDPEDPMAAFEGRKGGLLWAMSPTDGRKLAAWDLASPPVLDGLIAANGRLYLATKDGRVTCWSE
ncbi:MAG: PQQ-binding-like beta-propeller repeat protein [Planctomycetota bacterium]